MKHPVKNILFILIVILLGSAQEIVAQRDAASPGRLAPPEVLATPPPLKTTEPKATKPAKKAVVKQAKSDAKLKPKKRAKKETSVRTKDTSKPTRTKSMVRSGKNREAKEQKEVLVGTGENTAPVSETSESESESASPALPDESVKDKPAEKPVMGPNESIPFMEKPTAGASLEATSSFTWLKTTGSVALVLGLLFIGAWVFKKTGFAVLKNDNEAPQLQILSTVTPRNGQTISVVQFGGRSLLVGSTANSFTLLASDGHNPTGSLDSNPPFDFEGRPVSVSELLAKEENNFENELANADRRLSQNNGGLG